MNGKHIFESNRAAWNQALEYHQKARGNSLQSGFAGPAFTTLNRDCDGILLEKLHELGLGGKTIAQIPCNNGRELLSLMGLGAQEAVGFDISDAAVLEARQLAGIAKLNAKFVRTNVLEIGGEYDGYFDFIYISEGSL
ncbi:MAG: class I SAM-dependent methyltransferase [Clostridiales bacterium]|nr:class I SAM-dependent methyltransferase [Clostridiales bacterium]